MFVQVLHSTRLKGIPAYSLFYFGSARRLTRALYILVHCAGKGPRRRCQCSAWNYFCSSARHHATSMKGSCRVSGTRGKHGRANAPCAPLALAHGARHPATRSQAALQSIQHSDLQDQAAAFGASTRIREALIQVRSLSSSCAESALCHSSGVRLKRCPLRSKSKLILPPCLL